MKPKKIIVIGAGFSSISASCYLANAGYDVTILEKNFTLGGRARQYKKDGFVFDIGPTFYWMPDVFEDFFKDFKKTPQDFYQLKRLDPAYKVYFDEHDHVDIAGDYAQIQNSFEAIEEGSGKQLEKFMDNAESHYRIAINDLVYKPGQHILELASFQTVKKLKYFIQTIKQQVQGVVKNVKLRKILEFPVLFLGAKSSNTPAFYNFMNYADFKLGTWHPMGGMYEVVNGMHSLAKSLGVTFLTNNEVEEILIEDGKVTGVKTNHTKLSCDILLSGADYHHTESMLAKPLRQYTDKYWDKKTFSPSALLFYVGFDKKIKNVAHHTLFFDTDFEAHSASIYDQKAWPKDPLFYASFPGKTDPRACPEGKEAAIFLIPIASGLEDTAEIRAAYFEKIMNRLERVTSQELRPNLLFKESYCINDFKEDYNSYKGNAYGLANTLMQTHFLRPKLKSKKVDNLYFTGQLTVPGPGVPPAIISGKIVSELILKYHKI